MTEKAIHYQDFCMFHVVKISIRFSLLCVRMFIIIYIFCTHTHTLERERERKREREERERERGRERKRERGGGERERQSQRQRERERERERVVLPLHRMLSWNGSVKRDFIFVENNLMMKPLSWVNI